MVIVNTGQLQEQMSTTLFYLFVLPQNTNNDKKKQDSHTKANESGTETRGLIDIGLPQVNSNSKTRIESKIQ